MAPAPSHPAEASPKPATSGVPARIRVAAETFWLSLPTICSGRTIIGRTSAETPQDLTASSSHCAVLIFAPPYKPTDVESMHSSETDESLNIHVTHEGSIVTFAALSARGTSGSFHRSIRGITYGSIPDNAGACCFS